MKIKSAELISALFSGFTLWSEHLVPLGPDSYQVSGWWQAGMWTSALWG